MNLKSTILTDKGKKFSQLSIEEVSKVIESKDFTDYKDWLGIGVNPNLTAEIIDTIFDKINESEFEDKGKKDAIYQTRKKNRNLLFDILMLHPNLSDLNKALLVKNASSRTKVIKNPSLSKEHLQTYFDKWVINTAKHNYSYLEFAQLVKNGKQIDGPLLLKWYNAGLRGYANWVYLDADWFHILSTFLWHPECPVEIIREIVSVNAPPVTNINPLAGDLSAKIRDAALAHKNATPDMMSLAYEATKLEKYLPQEAKDIFLF